MTIFVYIIGTSSAMSRPFISKMKTVYPTLLGMYFLNKYDEHFRVHRRNNFNDVMTIHFRNENNLSEVLSEVVLKINMLAFFVYIDGMFSDVTTIHFRKENSLFDIVSNVFS